MSEAKGAEPKRVEPEKLEAVFNIAIGQDLLTSNPIHLAFCPYVANRPTMISQENPIRSPFWLERHGTSFRFAFLHFSLRNVLLW